MPEKNIGIFLPRSIFFNEVTDLEPITLLKKDTLTQMLSCECQIFKNTYFEEHLQTAAFEKYIWLRKILIRKTAGCRTLSKIYDEAIFWSIFFPYIPAFGLNMERYSVSLRIKSECGKIREKCGPNLG